MLVDEVAKYRRLSGDTRENTPITRIGGYLDGYEKGLEVIDKAVAELRKKAHSGQWSEATVYGMEKAIRIFDKHRKGDIDND